MEIIYLYLFEEFLYIKFSFFTMYPKLVKAYIALQIKELLSYCWGKDFMVLQIIEGLNTHVLVVIFMMHSTTDVHQ